MSNQAVACLPILMTHSVYVWLHRLWDMVDEFIYQFQSFSQYRGKLAQKSPHELELLKKCDGVWDLQGVLHYLQGLIDKSGVVRELSTDGEVPKPSPFRAISALLPIPPPLEYLFAKTGITLQLATDGHPPFPPRPQSRICKYSLCLGLMCSRSLIAHSSAVMIPWATMLLLRYMPSILLHFEQKVCSHHNNNRMSVQKASWVTLCSGPLCVTSFLSLVCAVQLKIEYKHSVLTAI